NCTTGVLRQCARSMGIHLSTFVANFRLISISPAHREAKVTYSVITQEKQRLHSNSGLLGILRILHPENAVFRQFAPGLLGKTTGLSENQIVPPVPAASYSLIVSLLIILSTSLSPSLHPSSSAMIPDPARAGVMPIRSVSGALTLRGNARHSTESPLMSNQP